MGSSPTPIEGITCRIFPAQYLAVTPARRAGGSNDEIRTRELPPSDDQAMRFRIRVARVQSVERVVNATDEQAPVAKIESELQKPCGMLGGNPEHRLVEPSGLWAGGRGALHAWAVRVEASRAGPRAW